MKERLKKHFTKKRIIAYSAIFVVASSIYGYRTFAQPKQESKYVLGTATHGMFIASLAGTGQVSGENQLDVKPTVSAAVVSLVAKEGQSVKAGDAIVELDQKDALKTIRDAERSVHDAQISLASSKLSYDKLRQPPTVSALLQSQDAVNAAERALAKLQEGPNAFDLQQAESQVTSAEQNARISSDGKTPQVIRNAYDTAVNTLVVTMQTVSGALSDADSVIGVDNTSANISFANLLSVMDQSQKSRAVADYAIAKASILNATDLTDSLAAVNEDPSKIDATLTADQDAVEKMTTLITDVSNALLATLTSSSFSQSSLDQLKSMIQGDRTSMNSKQLGLVSLVQALANAKITFQNSDISLSQAQMSLDKLRQPPDVKDVAAAQEKITEAKQLLADLKAGAAPIDVSQAQISVDQRASSLAVAEQTLADARTSLADYTIRAPFDGVLAKLPVHVKDAVSAGTAVTTIVGSQRIATITLNEIDATKVRVGQKATLTFDAVDGLSIAGAVEEVGALGTVTQGVVNYDVKIGFDTQDERIKPGMSVSAAIITETKPDVVLVPNAAVKASGTTHYVQLLDATSSTTQASSNNGAVTGTPRQQIVEVGESNDTVTEITSGLTGNESIVVQTIAPTTPPLAKGGATSSAIPGLGGGGAFRGAGGGGNFRGGGG